MAVGAIIGSFLLPVIGTFVGIFAGVLIGRKLTNQRKYKDLKDYEEKYVQSIKELNENTKKIQSEYERNFKETKKKEQDKLK